MYLPMDTIGATYGTSSSATTKGYNDETINKKANIIINITDRTGDAPLYTQSITSPKNAADIK
jgi:hypothetical protein